MGEENGGNVGNLKKQMWENVVKILKNG